MAGLEARGVSKIFSARHYARRHRRLGAHHVPASGLITNSTFNTIGAQLASKNSWLCVGVSANTPYDASGPGLALPGLGLGFRRAIAISCGGSTDMTLTGGAGTSLGGHRPVVPRGWKRGAVPRVRDREASLLAACQAVVSRTARVGANRSSPGVPLWRARVRSRSSVLLGHRQCFDPTNDPAACAPPPPDAIRRGGNRALPTRIAGDEFGMNGRPQRDLSVAGIASRSTTAASARRSGYCKVCGCDGQHLSRRTNRVSTGRA